MILSRQSDMSAQLQSRTRLFSTKGERASYASYAKCWALRNAEVATAVSWVLYSPISSSSVMGLTFPIHRLQIFERKDIQVTAVYPWEIRDA